MIRRLAGVAMVGAAAAGAVDRWLADRAGGAGPSPIRSEVVVDAPIDRTWSVVADIEGQPRWMHEMKRVRFLTDPPVGVGTRCEATVRVLGIEVADPVTITEWEPPHRFAVRHEGSFTGSGTISLEPGADAGTTTVRWEENPIPPVLPHLGSLAQRPVLAAIFQADLQRLKRLVEQEG